jgi:hypothetical protein
MKWIKGDNGCYFCDGYGIWRSDPDPNPTWIIEYQERRLDAGISYRTVKAAKLRAEEHCMLKGGA